MKSKILWALAVLNVLLAGTLVYRRTAAHAQVGAVRPGEYIMIPGEVTGGPSAVVYIIDETNRKLAARTYDENKKIMFDMAPIDLDRVFAAAAPANGRPR